ncbi:MAG TPA: hypothetical protein ENN46_02545 [Candidatus Woesearchaeota archaeon]|nr:hypothetical protein [Candidatus Woesearchaeota archaeon]
MKAVAGWLFGLGVTALASIMLILLGIVYFMLATWIIKLGATWAGVTPVDGNMVILTAGIITAASMIGSALKR